MDIKTGRDLLNVLKKMKDLDSPIKVSVFHHPHNDNEMPTIFGVDCVDELHSIPDNGLNYIVITCSEIHIPGTIDELTKDIDYKTMLTLNDDNSVDSKTIVEE